MSINPNINYIPSYIVNAAVLQVAGQFAASRVAYPLSVPKQIGILPVIDDEKEVFRIDDAEIAPGSAYPSFSLKTSKGGTYNATKKGFEYKDTIESIGNDDLNIFRSKGSLAVMHKMLAERDYRLRQLLVASYTSTGVNTDTPGNKWNAKNGTPLTDLRNSMQLIGNSQSPPNRLLMSENSIRVITNSDEYKDTIKFVTRTDNRPDAIAENLAAAIGIEKVELAKDVFINTAAKGATANMVNIWGDYAFLYRYEAPAVTFNGTVIMPVFTGGNASDLSGASTPFTGNTGSVGIANNFLLRQYFEDNTECAVMQGKNYYDYLLAASNTGFLWTGILA